MVDPKMFGLHWKAPSLPPMDRNDASTDRQSIDITTMTLAEFCAEADRIGLTASAFAGRIALLPEFADCLPARDKDGDALRLAIEHRISIQQQYGRVTAKGRFAATVSFRDCGGDRFAATREAIERAAGLPPQEPA